VDNIKMDLAAMGWGGVDWIGLAQDWNKWRALVNAVMNNGVFWDVTPLCSCKNRRFGGTMLAVTSKYTEHEISLQVTHIQIFLARFNMPEWLKHFENSQWLVMYRH
jgi:hypothetical protein